MVEEDVQKCLNLILAIVMIKGGGAEPSQWAEDLRKEFVSIMRQDGPR
jgi:hypothetical protein